MYVHRMYNVQRAHGIGSLAAFSVLRARKGRVGEYYCGLRVLWLTLLTQCLFFKKKCTRCVGRARSR
jgi:lysozyme family protein